MGSQAGYLKMRARQAVLNPSVGYLANLRFTNSDRPIFSSFFTLTRTNRVTNGMARLGDSAELRTTAC